MATAARTASAPTRRAFHPGTLAAPAVGNAIGSGRPHPPDYIPSTQRHDYAAVSPDPLSPA